MIGTPSADDRLLGINSLPRPPWKRRAQIGPVVLDLIAVLLGGATALLPVYARDILHTGPIGLGLLRSAPAVVPSRLRSTKSGIRRGGSDRRRRRRHGEHQHPLVARAACNAACSAGPRLGGQHAVCRYLERAGCGRVRHPRVADRDGPKGCAKYESCPRFEPLNPRPRSQVCAGPATA